MDPTSFITSPDAFARDRSDMEKIDFCGRKDKVEVAEMVPNYEWGGKNDER